MNDLYVKKTENKNRKGKILLMLLPFWTPLIPPLGISCLKSFLGQNGYDVKTVDANVVPELFETSKIYFNTLEKHIPYDKRGNFVNIAHNVLRNHLMVYLNKDESNDVNYNELINCFVYKHFFCDIHENVIDELDKMIEDFYNELEKYVIEKVTEEKPDVLGISVYTGTLAPSMFAFKVIKDKFPNIMTIMGGGVFADQLSVESPNFKAFMEKAPFIDRYIVGEGENLFLKLLNGEFPDEKKVLTLKDIDNETLDISKLPIPDFSDLDMSHYPQLTAYVSRSCPFQCSFCSETVQWGKYRKKDAKQVSNELRTIYEKYKYQLFLFGDSLLNPIINELSNELLENDISFYFDGYLRADKMVCDTENTLLWRRGGFYRARLGVESGSDNVLKLMDKRITRNQIREAVLSLAQAGIKTTTYWVIGHPGETEEDFQLTLDLIEELKDNLYEAECNPFNFFLTGQVASDKFIHDNSIELLYPSEASDMLITQTWILNSLPKREEIYNRVCRFVKHCRKHGIPNPYTMKDIYEADERWNKLQKNAVPSMIEFNNKNIHINENKTISKVLFADNVLINEDDFDF